MFACQFINYLNGVDTKWAEENKMVVFLYRSMLHKLHAIEVWAQVIAIEDISWCKKLLWLISLILPSEL